MYQVLSSTESTKLDQTARKANEHERQNIVKLTLELLLEHVNRYESNLTLD
jgi:hypothetical protein